MVGSGINAASVTSLGKRGRNHERGTLAAVHQAKIAAVKKKKKRTVYFTKDQVDAVSSALVGSGKRAEAHSDVAHFLVGVV